MTKTVDTVLLLYCSNKKNYLCFFLYPLLNYMVYSTMGATLLLKNARKCQVQQSVGEVNAYLKR